MELTFRQIKDEDFEFLRRLHRAALKDYIAQTWGWDEEFQAQRFRKEFNIQDGKIIVADGEDAGFLCVKEKETETVLVSIRLMPDHQNKGIGTWIIKDLLAKSEGCVTLWVLKVNPARKLYERLGFTIEEETETHFFMKREKVKSKK